MKKRIHIFGASGSGTTTLAKSIADTMGFKHHDTDSFFWVKTDPPFRTIRDRSEMQEFLYQALLKTDSWVLSGSLCGWGDFVIPMFDLVVYLYVPPDVRMQRLQKREIERYGPGIDDPKDPRYETHKAFLEWAAKYDTGGLDIRSRALHEKWLSQLELPCLRIEGMPSVAESTIAVLKAIGNAPETRQDEK